MKLVSLIPLKEIDFKNQDQFDAYSKAHELRPSTKVTIAGKVTTAGQAAKKSEPTKGSAVFGKDSGGSVFGNTGGASAKSDKPEPKKSTNWSFGALSGKAGWVAANSGLRDEFVGTWADENLVDLNKVADAINDKKLKFADVSTAVSGNPGNKYAKDIASKYSLDPKDFEKYPKKSQEPTNDIDGLTSHKDLDKFFKANKDKLDKKYIDDIEGEIGALKYLESDYKSGDADREEVDTAALEIQDLIKKALSKDEPISKPKEVRKGNPSVNKEAKKNAETFGITPQKLGNDGYKKAMYQAAVEALTDSNFHDEARELISKIEGKPEWAKRVDYPKMDDPKYKEKMADIRKNGVDSSEYWGGEDGTHEFARKVSSASGWDGADAADGIAFTLRMNGFHKQADMIQSVFDDKPYMKENIIKNNMKLVNLIPLREIDFRNQDQFDDYQKKHSLRPDTKVTIAGKVTTAGKAAQKSEPTKGSSVFGKDKGGDVFGKKSASGNSGGYGSKPGPNFQLKTKDDWDKAAKIGLLPIKGPDGKTIENPFATDKNNNGDWMDDLDSIDTSDIKGKANPDADSWKHDDVFGATFKDPETGKTTTVGDAYDREDDSPAYQKAFAYVSKFDPDGEAVMGTQAYADLNKKEAPKANLPKKASQLDYTHASSIADVVNAESGLDGYVDTDDNTDAIMYHGRQTGNEPTYTLYFGANDDYGKPDEFRVSLESTYGNDPAKLGGKYDKSFKSGDDAVKYMTAIAKKHKKELQMDDGDTNESSNLTSILPKNIKK